ncbi:acyl-CoA thioesterase [Prauserella rugosa]|uniref:Acyl-CoA thioesterase n=2 Tax=Prauserella rugosa TaxID=43354 RepID=A0A660CH11_9PSEU|nr:acyl-CoA thioesterase [Prauserella rugosa]
MSQPAQLAESARTMLESDAASTALGIEVTRAEHGHATARMTVTAPMVNGHDIAHGGYLFLFADTTFAAACNSHGPVTVASGAEISFVTSARLGDELVATAEERTRYGRNGIYDVTVHRETPGGLEVVAEFRGRSRTVGRIRD